MVLPLFTKQHANIQIRIGVIGVERNGLVEICDSLFVLTQVSVGGTAIGIGYGVIGIKRDGLVEW